MSQDLRSFLEILDEKNDLARVVKEVSPRYEVAALMRRGAEQDGPALFFERVRGSSIPLIANVLASRRRLALALGTTPDGILDVYRSRIKKPVPSLKVSGSGQTENISGLSSLPIITIHEFDAGPYITAGVIFAAHPESGKVNLSFQRMCPFSDHEAAIYVGETSDLAAYGRAACRKPLPVAVAIGLHPAFFLVASTRFPPEMEELEIVGGLLGGAVRLTESSTGQWIVPETAEIVLEGEIDFERTVPEGPFGEYPGYYGAGSLKPRQSPVITFHSLACRKDPIYQTVITGPTLSYESTYFSCLSKEAMLYTVLSTICPKVSKVNVLLSRYMAVVQVKGDLSGAEAQRIMDEVFSRLIYIKYVILVDADVDSTDPLDILWALSTRVDPGKDMRVFHDRTMEPLDPSTNGVCDKLGFDARKPVGEKQEGFVRTRIPGYEKIRLEDYLERR
jgi:2,5-furandicarboxylate decarboxylase 1